MPIKGREKNMLNNKIALITGSTSGIGLGIAQTLAEQGCHIMLNGFGDPQEIEKLGHTFEQTFHVKVGYSPADLSKPAQVSKMVQETEKMFGTIDILVNNAGIQFTSPTQDFPDDKWEAILSLNLSAAFYAIKAVLPFFQKKKWGRIINMASAHGLVGSSHKAAYVAAKHGLVGLTKVVSLENARENITCNAICPGWVDTPLVQKQIEDRAKTKGLTVEQSTYDLLSEKQPSCRFVQPRHLGDLVVFLCSEGGSSMTGTTLSMDGGWTAQ